MDKNLRKSLTKKRVLKACFFISCLLGTNAKYKFLKRNNVFALLGKNVLFQTNKLPNDPQFIKIHDNVKVASGVSFFNHDVINTVFNGMSKNEDGVLGTHIECIEIMENCFIGGNATILGGVKIGPNAIVAAGSVVVKDVPEGAVVGGNPARLIGDFWEIKNRRELEKNIKIFKNYTSIHQRTKEK